MTSGDMEVHSSINRTTMETFESGHPIGAFDFPMDDMTRRAGTTAMNYDGLLAYLQTKDYWWLARVYKNFNGQLDMHVRWSYSTRVHLYVLEFDPLHVEIGDDYERWPTPRDCYLARRAIRTTTSWTLAEYAAINEPYPAAAIATAAMDNDNAMDIDAAVNDTAMNDATINEAATAIDQGGTVFLFMVSSCFYSKSFRFILFFSRAFVV